MPATDTVRINGFTVKGRTVAERWAHFRALIELELAAKRPPAPDPDQRGSLLLPQPHGWKLKRAGKWHGKRRGYRQNEFIRRQSGKQTNHG